MAGRKLPQQKRGIFTRRVTATYNSSVITANDHMDISHDSCLLKTGPPGPTKARSEIAATKTRNFRTVGGQFSRMKQHSSEITATNTWTFTRLLNYLPKNRPARPAKARSEIAATKTRNFRTVGGQFSRMKQEFGNNRTATNTWNIHTTSISRKTGPPGQQRQGRK